MTDNDTNQEKKECEVKLFFVVVLSFLNNFYLFLFLSLLSQKNPHNLKENKGFEENTYLALLRTRCWDCVTPVVVLVPRPLLKTFLVFYFVGGEVNFFESFRFFSKLK